MPMEFKNIEELYDYLENDTKFKFLDLNTYKYIQSLRDRIKGEKNKKICAYELYFSEFSIRQGVHIPKIQTDLDSYPKLELFDDDFEYIKSRADHVINPKYKAKYNHLLWLSPQKHIEFAKKAIINYLKLLQNHTEHAKDFDSHSFRHYYENVFVLSQKIKYKNEEVIQYLIYHLDIEKLNALSKCSLMKFVIENGKKLDVSTKILFYDYSEKVISTLKSRELESYLKLLVFISKKLKLSSNKFHEKLGDNHISQLDKEKEKSLIAYHYYTLALEEFKQAGNKEKIERTAVLLEQSKKDIKLKKTSYEFKDEELNKMINDLWDAYKVNITHILENYDSKVIYEFLILEKLFPEASALDEKIGMSNFDLFNTMSFDINKNLNKTRKIGINPYFLYVDNLSVRLIYLVFNKGLMNGKISFESFIDYLKNYTWYGQNFQYVDNNNEVQGFNWIELLSPILKSFFQQREIDVKTKKSNPHNYILIIDSLVLKFEGLLREFLKNIGARTIEIDDKGTKERVGFDKLLENKKLKDIIPADDIAYFKFLFTSSGINLRNNIAHCFYTSKHYSSAHMLLMIVALLRLGNFKLKT